GEGPEQGEPVGLVDQQLLGIGEHPARAEERLHLAPEGLLAGVGQGGHGGDYSIGREVAPRAGLEPATLRLTAGCSTIELSGNPGGNRPVHFYHTAGRSPSIATPSRAGL